MDIPPIFNFKAETSEVHIPEKLNNPFGNSIPKIAKIAAKEFQEFISLESQNWKHNFTTQKGKMFGVLVVQKPDNTVGYLGTISGKLPTNETCIQFVPSLFDESTNDFFLTKGMIELTEMSNEIKKATTLSQINSLTELRAQKSFALQQQLFAHYRFLNLNGTEKNVLEIFKNSSQGNPPAAAGECAAPKLLQFAFEYQLKPIAIAEFWWGSHTKNKEKTHKDFYPACKNRCRPILEFMLDYTELFNQINEQ
jgi:tRNA pseudouridine32 synthase/23S rRNA pseudouridine746 synthase